MLSIFQQKSELKVNPVLKPEGALNRQIPFQNSKNFVSAPAIASGFTFGNLLVNAPGAVLQAKLSVSIPCDKYEQEADAISDKVMRIQEEDSIGHKPLSYGINPLIQAKGGSRIKTSHEISDKISASRGSGTSIDSNTQTFMSDRFGFDFSKVKIHTDDEAVQLNREISARAFTVGNDIYFNEGEYNPGSDKGKYLLGHELTHVLQQKTVNKLQRVPEEKSPDTKYWWIDKKVGIKPHNKFWKDVDLFFPGGNRKFSGAGLENIPNIMCDDTGMVRIGQAYWEETDPMIRKGWIIPMIEKIDQIRYNKGWIDNQDLTDTKIINKLKALSGIELQNYIKKLTEMSKYITNDLVIAYLNGNEDNKLQILKTEKEKFLDLKFKENRLTDEDLKDEKTNTRLRGLSTADKLDKEKKAKEFAEKTGEKTTKLQSFLHTQTITSTPVTDEATVNSTGGFTMNFPNVDVIVLPDISGGKGNETSINTNLPKGSYSFGIGGDGLITEFFKMEGKKKTQISFPSKLVITIQTRYEDISKVDETSAYGRGTTADDIQWGGKTLRFHEGSHGKEYIDFIKSHTFPSLAIGSVKQEDIKTTTGLLKEMDIENCRMVDQVGTTQDDYLKTQEGKKSGIVSCSKKK